MLKNNIKLSVMCLVAVSLAFILSGCGNKDESQKQDQNQTQTSQQNQSRETETQKEGNESSKNSPQNGNPAGQRIEACNGKSEGDSCEVSLRRKNSEESESKMAGVCKKMREEKEGLSCVPENMPQGGPGREMSPSTMEE